MGLDAKDFTRCVWKRLAPLEERLWSAKPGLLDWLFWNSILEVVEELPPVLEARWKVANLPRLRLATGRTRPRRTSPSTSLV